jgi:hypothetical protein
MERKIDCRENVQPFSKKEDRINPEMGPFYWKEKWGWKGKRRIEASIKKIRGLLMDQKEIDQICIQIAWLERYLFELDCILPHPLPEMNRPLEVMDRTAPHFFGMLSHLLIDNIYLTISRLLDPVQQGRNTNLTIETLINNNLSDPQKTSALSELSSIRVMFGNGREIRNKLIAHPDYQMVYGYPKNITPVPIDELNRIGVKTRLLVERHFSSPNLPQVHPKNDTSWHGVNEVLRRLGT